MNPLPLGPAIASPGPSSTRRQLPQDNWAKALAAPLGHAQHLSREVDFVTVR